MLPSTTVAVVVTFEIAIATDGTTATLPPAAPVFALTVAACVVEEASVRSWPPVSDPLRLAVVLSSITATPTDAPMPTEPTPVTPAPVGNASVAVVAFDAAAMRTSPAPALSVPSSDAFVLMFSMSIATEPAMPTAPPPAPLVAEAPSSCSELMTASIVAPRESTVACLGRTASLAMRT